MFFFIKYFNLEDVIEKVRTLYYLLIIFNRILEKKLIIKYLM